MSNETKWTPGPWVVRDCPMERAATDLKDNGGIKLIDYKDEKYEGTLAIVQTELSQANAHIIAAAPELYTALEELMTLVELEFDAYNYQEQVNARAALAKARGEA